MKYSIALKRLNDETRYVSFDTGDDVKKMCLQIYNQVWNLIFDQTSDSKFASTFLLHCFSAFKTMIRFYKLTHKKSIYLKYQNFSVLFSSCKDMLSRFNYWNKQETHTIFILKENTNILLRADQILLNK